MEAILNWSDERKSLVSRLGGIVQTLQEMIPVKWRCWFRAHLWNYFFAEHVRVCARCGRIEYGPKGFDRD